MRTERHHLDDILDSIDKILRYTRGLNFDDFEKDEQLVDAVIRNFEVIGEASNNLSDETYKRAKEIPWTAIISMRNMLTHEYFGVDLVEVWKTISDDLPVLKTNVEAVRASLGEAEMS